MQLRIESTGDLHSYLNSANKLNYKSCMSFKSKIFFILTMYIQYYVHLQSILLHIYLVGTYLVPRVHKSVSLSNVKRKDDISLCHLIRSCTTYRFTPISFL